MKSEYVIQAEEFLKNVNATMEITFNRCDFYFSDDKEKRNIYDIHIERNGKTWDFEFGDSLYNTEKVNHFLSLSNVPTTIGTARGQYLNAIQFPRYNSAKERAVAYLEQFSPNAYDVLACIEKYEPYYDDVWEFANEFGYEIHDRESYRKVEDIFLAVKKEYRNVMRMFGDVIEELQEIQ